MVRSTTLRAWQAEVVEALVQIGGVRPALLIVDDRPQPARSPIVRVKRLAGSKHLVWDVYNNGWVARRSRALQPVDMSAELGRLPRIPVTVERKGFSEYFPEAAVESIREHDLDFILRFAFGIIRGSILDAARQGVWSFHHGDEERYRGSPPAYWEMVDDQPTTGAILQRLTDRLDGGIVLDKGWFPTVRHSYVRNTDSVRFGGVDWPARAARRLLADGDLGSVPPSTSLAPIYRRPRNSVAARFLLSLAGRFVAAQVRGLTRGDHWDIGVVRAPIGRFVDPAFEPEVEWQRVTHPGKAYAADPFAVPVDPPQVLFERYDSRRRVGEIWQMPPSEASSATLAGLPINGHASYPFCFENGSRVFCVPQVATDGVPLFELRGGRWCHVVDLLPGHRIVDPTIVRHGGRWWMFGTRPGRDALTKLHLWFAEELEGPWTAHALNPVKTDVRSARPAGTPFLHNGLLHRPAQDCSSGYGGAVAVCEVTRLDENDFAEHVVRIVRAAGDWPWNEGIHTLSAAGDVTLLDARRSVFDRHEAVAELRGRVRRLRRVAPEGGSRRSLHALAVIDALGEGGTERSLAELMPGLRDRGIDVTVAILRSRGEEGVEQLLRAQGFDVRVLPPGRSRYRALRRLVAELRPDIVHSMLFDSNLTARLATIGQAVPVLTSLVNTSYGPERLAIVGDHRGRLRLVQAFDAVSGRLFVDHFHAVSESVRVAAMRDLRVPADRLSVVKRGRRDPRDSLSPTARADVRAELGIPAGDLVVVSVGRQEPQKDHVTLLRSMAPILAQRDDVWLLVAGREGNASPQLQEVLGTMPDRRRVLFLGHRRDVPAVLAAADVFVLTSRHEGLPGAVIEAMAAGLPVVASDIGPVREVVQVGASALLAVAGGPASFTRAVGELLDDADQRRRLGSRGRTRYEERFTIDVATDAMADLYRRAAAIR